MSYKLFSRIATCAPCRQTLEYLERSHPHWRNKIEYIDVDDMNMEQYKIVSKAGVARLPSMVKDEQVIFTGFNPKELDKICIQE